MKFVVSKLKALWAEDDGFVITTEYLLVVSVLFFGLIPAYVGARNLAGAAILNTGNLSYGLTTQAAVPGYGVVGTNGVPVAYTASFFPNPQPVGLVLAPPADGFTATGSQSAPAAPFAAYATPAP